MSGGDGAAGTNAKSCAPGIDEVEDCGIHEVIATAGVTLGVSVLQTPEVTWQQSVDVLATVKPSPFWQQACSSVAAKQVPRHTAKNARA